MAGRRPKLDGRKAMEGGRGIVFEPVSGHDALEPPKGLGHYGRFAWRQALRSLAPANLIAHGDLLAFEAMCRAWGRWRTLEREIDRRNREARLSGDISVTPNGFEVTSALRNEASRALKEFSRLAGEFGLTPVARVKTVGTAQGDLFDWPAGKAAASAAPAAPDPSDPYASLPRFVN